MRVKAKNMGMDKKYVGYYNYVRRKPGDVFDLIDEKDFNDLWMENVDSSIPKTVAPGEPDIEEVKRSPGRPKKEQVNV